MVDTCLSHDGVCYMTGFYLAVYREILFCQRAVPYVMIAFTVSHESAAILHEDIPHFLLKPRHQAMLSVRAAVTYSRAPSTGLPFNSRIS